MGGWLSGAWSGVVGGSMGGSGGVRGQGGRAGARGRAMAAQPEECWQLVQMRSACRGRDLVLANCLVPAHLLLRQHICIFRSRPGENSGLQQRDTRLDIGGPPDHCIVKSSGVIHS